MQVKEDLQEQLHACIIYMLTGFECILRFSPHESLNRDKAMISKQKTLEKNLQSIEH